MMFLPMVFVVCECPLNTQHLFFKQLNVPYEDSRPYVRFCRMSYILTFFFNKSVEIVTFRSFLYRDSNTPVGRQGPRWPDKGPSEEVGCILNFPKSPVDGGEPYDLS